MEIKPIHIISISIAIVGIVISLFFLNTKFFLLIIGLSILAGAFPFVYFMINETQVAEEKEQMFLEFARNLVESSKTGTPISKSIMNASKKPYGVLGKHVNKLANQIQLGIPLRIALQTFAKDVHNKTITRALTLIGQAERAGGDIGEILESVTEAVSMSGKLKKERKAMISTLVIQGYIIFFVFIAIVLVMQFKILPMMSGIININEIGFNGSSPQTSITQDELSNAFLYLLLSQGFFSGLAIGKLAEGTVKAGIKHSFSLMLISFLVSALSSFLLG